MARYGRVIRYLLWGVGLAALLVGCGNLSLMAPREPVTIRFAGPGADGSLDALIEEFQKKHKHVVIEVVTENIYRFEQLEDIDIILVPNFILPELIEREYPISLDALMQGDKDFDPDDIYPVADAAMSIEGRRWAVPYMLDATMMFYNRDLFDRYGVPYPTADWTWDDLLERARLLTHADRGEYGFAYQQSGNPRDTELMLLIYQYGGQLYDDLETPTRMILNDPNTVIALQWYADLIYRHYVAPPPGQRTPPYPLQGIEEGRYAMWTGNFSDAWQDLNVGRAALPHNRSALTFGSVLGFVISANAQDPQACWEWVSYLTQQTPPGLIPARRSQLDAMTLARGMDEAETASVRASVDHLMVLNPFQYGEFRSRGQKALQAYERALVAIQNGEPVEATLNEAQRSAGY